MRFIVTFILLFGIIQNSFAQEDKLSQLKIDSLSQKLKKDSSFIFRPKMSKPYLRVENRYTFVSHELVSLIGFMAGITYHKKHIFCAGYYTLNKLTRKSIDIKDENNIIRREYLNLNYFNLSYQYIPLNNRFFQIRTPLEIGYGGYSTKTTDGNNNYLNKSSGKILPLSAGIQFIFKPLRWAGISCSGGYRSVIEEKNIELDFTGFYYSFGLWINAQYSIRHTRYFFKKRKYNQHVENLHLKK